MISHEVPDAVVVIDGSGTVVEANDAAVELTGRSRGGLVGSDVARVLDLRTDSGRSVWSHARPSHAELHQRSFLLTDTGGREVVVQATVRLDRSSRGGEALVVALRPRRETPDAMEVVATVSHELRSPLTSVKGYTSLMLHRWSRLSDDQKRFMLEQVHHDADRVTRLVTELLDISRLETGRLTLRRQLVDVEELAASVVTKVRLEHRDLDCTVEVASALPTVSADPDKIEQVLTNLLENAVKYAGPTGVRITGEASGDDIVVSVHDRGEGIPQADLPRVFERFFQTGHGRPSGTGLGLWISRGLVEAHGGTLTATSEVGRGSVFSFTLPLSTPPDEGPDR